MRKKREVKNFFDLMCSCWLHYGAMKVSKELRSAVLI